MGHCTRFASFTLALAAGFLLIPIGAAAISESPATPVANAPQKLAPYAATPQDVVEKMLAIAHVTSADVVYDLGSGDGRVVITAAKTYGARGVGIDIDPERIAESRANAKKAGVESLVEFREQDVLKADISAATVVTLYLLSTGNMRLRPTLQSTLRPGARVVSHQFGMGDWAPARTETFTDSLGANRTIYLWQIGK